MYYTLNTLAFPTLPTTPQASVASMIVPSEPVLGRLPATQVAGTVAYETARNEVQNNPPYVNIAADQSTPDISSFTQGSAQSSDTSISAFPSLFLAQLMGQDSADPQTQSVIDSYAALPRPNTAPKSGSTASTGFDMRSDFFKALQELGSANTSALAQKSAPQQSAPPPQTTPQLSLLEAPYVSMAERKFPGNFNKPASASPLHLSRGTQAYRFTAERNALLEEAVPEPSFA